MPSRIATGPAGDPDRLKALIVARPAIVEEGLRVLDVDLAAGPAGRIDAVCVDGAGALTLLAVCRGDLETTLTRLLDQHLWAIDQLDLLRRLYSGAGLVQDRPARCLLVAPSFTYPFLRRLSLLAVRVTACLARALPAGHEGDLLIEPAAALFGLETEGPTPPHAAPSGETAARAVWTRATDDGRPGDADAGERTAVTVTGDLLTDAGPDGAILGPDGLPDPLFQEETEADPFETLTADELAEFDRFDAQRRERGGSPA